MAANPYDLAAGAPPDGDLLRGYCPVPPEVWPQLGYGKHVRYRTKTGELRRGGFIAKNPFFAGQPPDESRPFVKLQTGFNRQGAGHADWVVAYEDIDTLWVKVDAAVTAVYDQLRGEVAAAVKALDRNLRRVADFTRGLEGRIAALEHRRPR